uniref:DUF6589 domain-containing protein n=1 Tax=Schizophyllum commune (strain H4-8 / FGSC 9210) TaxID=578458 RepID=D8PYY4_SCHCM
MADTEEQADSALSWPSDLSNRPSPAAPPSPLPDSSPPKTSSPIRPQEEEEEPIPSEPAVPFLDVFKRSVYDFDSEGASPPASRADSQDSGYYKTSPPIDLVQKGAQKNRDHNEEKRAAKAQAEAEAAAARAALAAKAKEEAINKVLDALDEHDLTFGDILVYVFGDGRDARWRWKHVYKDTAVVNSTILAMASRKNPPQARRKAEDAMVDVAARVLDYEAASITKKGVLRPPAHVDQDFVCGFELDGLPARLEPHCPSIVKVLHSIAQTRRQEVHCSQRRLEHKKFITAACTTMLLGERSQHNSWFQHVFGLYLYTQGASRQLITVLNHMSVSVSYATLAGRGGKSTMVGDVPEPAEIASRAGVAGAEGSRNQDGVPVQRRAGLGTLEKLSLAMREVSRHVAASRPFMVVYDNINMMWRVAEQIIGRRDSLESGTCATLVPLHDADPRHLATAALAKHVDEAPELNMVDVRLTPDYKSKLHEYFEFTVLRIIVRFAGGEKMKSLGELVHKHQPYTDARIPTHLSEVHPLPAEPIDESTKKGNADVITAFMEELGQPIQANNFADMVRLIAGDQLSVARSREVAAARAGNEGGAPSLRWALFMPGLFHYKMAATSGLLLAHLGKKNRDLTNPASLHAHNTILRRKPIIVTSLPPFRTGRDLIFVSLYARILHCLLLVSGKQSLADYVNDPNLDWTMLRSHAQEIVRRFADPDVASTYRRARDRHGAGEGDMVFENAVLFMRDALLLREFTDAIKAGDSGRIVHILESYVHVYRAQGRHKYAHETLHLLHNLKHVWPKEVRDIVLRNWLVNTTNRPNAFLEVDLLQEHLNYWIKNFFQAHGSNASWAWLATISPCIQILRSLANQVHKALGGKQGSRHAEPDLTNDIAELMDSLSQHQVYTPCKGRQFDEDDESSLVAESVITGMNMLTAGGKKSPLENYNAAFRTLQSSYRIRPLVGGAKEAGASQPRAGDPPSAAQAPDADEDMEDGMAVTEDEDEGASVDGDEAQSEPPELAINEDDVALYDDDGLSDRDAEGETDLDELSNADSDVESCDEEDDAPGFDDVDDAMAATDVLHAL